LVYKVRGVRYVKCVREWGKTVKIVGEGFGEFIGRGVPPVDNRADGVVWFV